MRYILFQTKYLHILKNTNDLGKIITKCGANSYQYISYTEDQIIVKNWDKCKRCFNNES